MPLVESGLLAAFAFGLGFLLSPADPLLQESGFSYTLLAPLAAGLVHGLSGGLLSAGVLLALQVLVVGSPAAVGYGLPCLIVAVLTGLAHDRKLAVQNSLQAELDEMGATLRKLTVRHQLVTVSHKELSVRLSAEQWSLMGATEETERALSQAASPAEAAAALMSLVAAQGRVESATLLIGRSLSSLTPLGGLGKASTPTASHPLIRASVEENRLVSVVNQTLSAADGQVLVAMPLKRPDGGLVGVLAIHRMPFIAFEASHLRRIMLLGSAMAGPLSDRLAQLQGMSVTNPAPPAAAPVPAPSRPPPLPDFAHAVARGTRGA